MNRNYNLSNVRALLTVGFTTEELRRLCYDTSYFRPVYEQLAENSSKTEIVDRLIEHTERKLQLDILLELVKQSNPAQYEQYQPYYEHGQYLLQKPQNQETQRVSPSEIIVSQREYLQLPRSERWLRSIKELALQRSLAVGLCSGVIIILLTVMSSDVQKNFLSSQEITFQSDRDGDFEIWVMNADGGNPRQMTNNEEFDDWSPDWSCDNKIAFESNRDGNFEIYVMNRDGTNQTRLTFDTEHDRHPSWSPDGKQITFMTNRDDHNEDNDDDYQIYVMNADGTGPHPLTYDKNDDRNPDWSPDGSQIVYQSKGEAPNPDNYEIYVMNADGTNQNRLTHLQSAEQHPNWSPDGEQIAFSTNRAGYLQAYVMNTDGTNQHELTETSNFEGDWYPVWSIEGERIAFRSSRNGDWEIFVVNADGTNPRRLTNGTGDDGGPTWSPTWFGCLAWP
jgi:Tol biopolymer transport system component